MRGPIALKERKRNGFGGWRGTVSLRQWKLIKLSNRCVSLSLQMVQSQAPVAAWWGPCFSLSGERTCAKDLKAYEPKVRISSLAWSRHSWATTPSTTRQQVRAGDASVSPSKGKHVSCLQNHKAREDLSKLSVDEVLCRSLSNTAPKPMSGTSVFIWSRMVVRVSLLHPSAGLLAFIEVLLYYHPPSPIQNHAGVWRALS